MRSGFPFGVPLSQGFHDDIQFAGRNSADGLPPGGNRFGNDLCAAAAETVGAGGQTQAG